MKIVLDNIIYFLQNSGGGSVYWNELTKRINESKEDVCFVEPKGESSNIFRKKINFKKVCIESKIPLSILRFLSFQKKIDGKYIFHSSYYRISKSRNAKNITTIHDFTPELYFKGIRRRYNSFRNKKILKKSQGIICISENTKKDLLRFHPDVDENKIKVIYNGVGDNFFKLGNTFDKNSFPYKEVLDHKYILYVGHRTSYKNFGIVPQIIKSLDESYKLLIIGEALNKEELNELELTIPGRYIIKSRVSSENLNIFYNFAFCLLYPSSYEGFGIPVLEAMKTECPVVATSMSSIPEVAGDAAILIDKIEPTLFSEGIKKLENEVFRKELIDKGITQSQKFTWDKCAEEVLSFYRKIYNE